ncbi:MAG: hypothetical protein WAM79_18620 [Candidatus Sulfotelmatobacter sp.]
MDDLRIYRWSGACGLAAIAVFFIEFPFYLVRSGFPGVTDPAKIADFTATYATNVMTCVFFDFIILTLLMIFLAGFRHLIRQANRQHEWLGTLVFGVGLVYITLTLVADSLQAATVIDARTVPASGVIIRAMLESTFLMYGSVALFLMAVLMAMAGYVGVASRALPAWSAWVGYLCAVGCLAFVPSMFVGSPDIMRFYNPAGWGPEAIASGFPLAAWMITIGILMVRMREPVARPAAVAA